MIVVDTSIWVNAFRNQKSSEARHLSNLLDNDEVAIAMPIRIELLSGARRSDQARLSRTLSALPIYFPKDATWHRIEGWLATIKNAGDRFGVGDLLIAGIAVENRAAIWSLDGDFARMAKLKLIELHRL
jgi:predicted nucleic acid-binding protein